MIYNIKLMDKKLNNYEKLNYFLNIKKYLLYGLIVFLLSRVNILFYMAPIGIAFTLVCIFKNNRICSLIVCISSILGYLSARNDFIIFDLYVIINIFLLFFIFLNVNKQIKKFLSLGIVSIVLFSYKYFNSGFSILSSLFYMITEISIILALWFIFSNFMKFIKYFKTNEIFTREDIICLVVTICLSIAGFNNINLFNLDIANIILIVFILILSYVNGISIGMISAVFSGIVIGIIYGDISKYVAIYSLISCITSILYLSSRFSIILVSCVCILLINFSSTYFIGMVEILFLIEIFISMLIFLLLPSNILNNLLIHLNEEHKREFHTQKRLFNTLDMRIQKINDFNEIIKQLSDMLISNVNLRYKSFDKKIYIEILAENVCSNCNKINFCWKSNFKVISDQLLLSFDNFIQGNKILTKDIEDICILKDNIKNELSKISNFYNMKNVYENKIYEAQNVLSYELNNVHNIIEQGMKEVKKDIVVKVDYEKNLINKFNKFNIKYFDLMCYEENNRLKVKIILSYDIYCEYKSDILDIINLALSKNMLLQEESIQYINSKEEIILIYVERYDYNIISHCLQLSKNEKNGDSYIFTKNTNDDYLIILSDGIGSGSDAYDKSKFTVDLIYKFMKTSLSLSSCIKEIISIISLKFFRDESISTIDFASINLYTGKMNFLKFSSVFTYVKRGDEIFVLENYKDLFNEYDKKEDMIFIGEFNLQYGDILVHLTDGLVYFKDLSDKSWLYKFLKRTEIISPDKLCEEIIREFKFLNDGSFQDDVSVIVSKVYKNSY